MTSRSGARLVRLAAVVAFVAACGSNPSPQPTEEPTPTGVAIATPTPGALVPAGLWVATKTGDLLEFDPASAKTARTISLATGESVRTMLAYSAGSVWATVWTDAAWQEVVRVDTATGEVARIAVGERVCCVSADETAVWVGGTERGVVVRLDPRTGAVVGSSEVGGTYPRVFPGGASPVAVLARERAELVRLDEHGAPLQRRTVEGPIVSRGAVLGDDLWVEAEKLLVAFSTATLERTRLVDVEPLAVTAGDGAVWVAGYHKGSCGSIRATGPRPSGLRSSPPRRTC